MLHGLNETLANRVDNIDEYDRNRFGCLLHRFQHRAAIDHQQVRRQRGQFRRRVLHAVAVRQTIIDPHIVAVRPAQLLEPLQERRDADGRLRIARREIHQHADALHALGALRPRRERPDCRAADKGDEVASCEGAHYL